MNTARAERVVALRNRRTQLQAAGEAVQEQLIKTEEALDSAMREQAKLLDVMLRARTDANVAHSVGQSAVRRVWQAQGGLVEARSHTGELHADLLKVADRLNIALPSTMFGKDGGQPDPGPQEVFGPMGA